MIIVFLPILLVLTLGICVWFGYLVAYWCFSLFISDVLDFDSAVIMPLMYRKMATLVVSVIVSIPVILYKSVVLCFISRHNAALMSMLCFSAILQFCHHLWRFSSCSLLISLCLYSLLYFVYVFSPIQPRGGASKNNVVYFQVFIKYHIF